MPWMAGTLSASVSGLWATFSAPLDSAVACTSVAGRLKRMAKPQTLGACSAAKAEANEFGSSLTRKLHSPWRYMVIFFVLCFATAAKPSFGNSVCSRVGSGAANSTNSKPSTPCGFSKVVTSIPILGWALIGDTPGVGHGLGRLPSRYSFTFNQLQRPEQHDPRNRSRPCPAGARAFPALSAVHPVQHGEPVDRHGIPGSLRTEHDGMARDDHPGPVSGDLSERSGGQERHG